MGGQAPVSFRSDLAVKPLVICSRKRLTTAILEALLLRVYKKIAVVHILTFDSLLSIYIFVILLY